jgi:TetR/AcrR family transcriptional regulator, mexJK operon transcriptional repressor
MTEIRTAAPLTRSALKRQTILAAGQDLFLTRGYQGTSVDQIAAAAAVSKQTVYKHFGDKQELLLAIVAEALERIVSPFLDRIAALAQSTDLESDLVALASDYLRAVLQGPVVQLRRLVIGEANRLPELAKQYYDQAQSRTLAAFAGCFAVLDDRGLLRVPEPPLAAEHFAFLIVGRSIDQALFCGAPKISDSELDAHVRAGVRVFLAGYRVQPDDGRG